jgi:hypothetical protein
MDIEVRVLLILLGGLAALILIVWGAWTMMSSDADKVGK